MPDEPISYDLFLDQIAKNMGRYILQELRRDFPQIRSFGYGLTLDDHYGRELTEEEASALVGFIIVASEDFTEEQRREIRIRIAEKFVKFSTIGEPQLAKDS